MGTQNGKSPLQLMTSTTPTSLWNDSCSIAELEYVSGAWRGGRHQQPGDRR